MKFYNSLSSMISIKMRIARSSDKSARKMEKNWKLELTEKLNPKWIDFVNSLLGLYFLDPAVKPRDDGGQARGDGAGYGVMGTEMVVFLPLKLT